MTRARDDGRPGIARDARGAVMVIAVFMAAFLTGGLWYVIGVGDAAIYRERMQDGADAIAYAAAVYHARGMNIIAMINLVMAALVAILVFLKLIQLANWIVMGIACALCASIVGSAVACPICDVTKTIVDPWIGKVIDAWQKVLDKVLPVLSTTQKVVAIAAPWAGEVKAYMVSQQYSKPVQAGGMISVSLLPGSVENKIVQKAGGSYQSKRIGLPVQEDKYSVLCQKAGEMVGGVAGLLPIPGAGAAGSWLGSWIGKLAKTFPAYFCGGVDASSIVGAKGAEEAKQVCEEQKKKAEKDKDKSFDFDKCKKDATKDATKAIKDKLTKATGSGFSGDNKTPKKVYDKAENGDLYFQIWAIAWGETDWVRTADRGVDIAAWSQASVKPPPFWGHLHFAQAEFYYDCKGDWTGKDCNQDSNAMWNMKWRARMRRFRPPALGDWIAGQLTQKLGDFLSADKGMGKWILGKLPWDKFLGQNQTWNKVIAQGASLFGQKWDQIVTQTVKGWVKGPLQKGGSWLDDPLANAVGNDVGIIH